jgi:hypothetical protein
MSRLVHDEAWLLAQQILAMIGHLLREEERKDAFSECYRLATEAIRRFAEAEVRMRQRLRPEGEQR